MKYFRGNFFEIFSTVFTVFVLLTLTTTSRGQDCEETLTGDIFISLDESGSVRHADFQTSLAWTVNLLSFFQTEIEDGNIRVGVDTFSSYTTSRIPLANYTYSELSSSILSINNRGGGTQIGRAIDAARNYLSIFGRQNVTQIIIILTDGQSGDNVLIPSEQARSSGIITASVGVGSNTDDNTLLEIAGSADRKFQASDFNNLDNATLRLRQELFDIICQDLPFVLQHGIYSIDQSSQNITSTISNFNFYNFDSANSLQSYITDGGSDMYDVGNLINIYSNGVPTAITYNVIYSTNDAQFVAKTGYPFYTLIRIDNPSAKSHSYSIQVYGNAGADGRGNITTSSGTATRGTFTIEYRSFQIYGAGDPTICEVYFILYSAQTWRSVQPSSFNASFGSSTDNLNNVVTITGTPSKMLMGYTLLSRAAGVRISGSEISDAMVEIMKASSKEIDHCYPGNELCHSDADCVDVDGGFICVCKSGYTGNGRFCERDAQPSPLRDVSCSPHSITIQLESEYYESRDVALENLHLNDFSCGGYADLSTPDVWWFRIPSLSSCSTSLTRNSTHLIYSNTISDALEGGLYTGTLHTASFACVFSIDLNVTLSTNYDVLHNVINVTGPAGIGHYVATLNQFTDNTHSTQHATTVYRPTDTIYIMVRINSNESTINLVINNCWVTPTPAIDHQNAFTFIENRCSVPRNPGNLQITNNGNGNSAHFQSQIFAFINYDTTYLHCSLQICSSANGANCIPTCRSKRSSSDEEEVEKRRKRQATSGNDEVVSFGPFTVDREDTVSVIEVEDPTIEDPTIDPVIIVVNPVTPVDEGSFGIPLGALIGAIAGTVVIIACLVVAWTCFHRRQQQRLNKKQPDGFTNPALQNVEF